MKILALDLSLTGTGYCLTHPKLEWGTLRPPKKLDGMARLDWIYQQIGELARTADLVVMEGLAFGANFPGAAERIMLTGLVRHWLWKHETPLVLVAPSSSKKFLTGSGRADKNLILREVFKRYGADCADDNQADAVNMTHVGMALAGTWQPTTDAQRQVLKTLRKSNQEALDVLALS